MDRHIEELLLNYLVRLNTAKAIVKPKKQQLTDREYTVASYLSMGMRSSEIARSLNLKTSTISTFKNNIYRETKVKNSIELKEVLKL
ncbi:helix-turn-helix transcriptional regulator [Dyadobacter sp. CY312]|uniref:helix-turn-helix transcriptional regulator n=1 Tax=Dyadobacter sp. CY312 TaxID=2907303 RepID=UPI0038D401AE